MRAIDADAMLKRLEEWNTNDRMDRALYNFTLNRILEQPTIEPEQKWIPCSDPSDLPKDKRLWITREISDGFFTLREVSDVIWDMTEWSDSVSGVVAYMPYVEPEPYEEEGREG